MLTGSCSDASRLEDYSDSELDPDYPPRIGSPPPESDVVSTTAGQFIWDLLLDCAERAVDTANRPGSIMVKIPRQDRVAEVRKQVLVCENYANSHISPKATPSS